MAANRSFSFNDQGGAPLPPPPPASSYHQQDPYQDQHREGFYGGREHYTPYRSTQTPSVPYDGDVGRPSVPAHHDPPALGYSNSQRSNSSATPGMDNLGESAAGGGIAGIALGVAANNERQSGVQAWRAIENGGRAGPPVVGRPMPMEGRPEPESSDSYGPPIPSPHRAELHPQLSYSSTMPLRATTGSHDSDISLTSYPSQYTNHSQHVMDNPYKRYSTTWDHRIQPTALEDFNPNDIEDDGDDGLAPHVSRRKSVLSFGRHSSNGMLSGGGGNGSRVGAGAGAAAVGGGFMGSLGRLVGRDGKQGHAPVQMASGQYGPVPGGSSPSNGFGGSDQGVEKSEWLDRQAKGNKKLKWAVGAIIVILVLGAIAGGVVGGVLGTRHKSTTSSGSRGSDSKSDKSGDLTKDSAEIQSLMGNANLHKVFPGVDYTPLNGQYPDCLTNPASQNDITQDVAVLSQMTNKIRLYGTDCNQTEMLLHSIDALGLNEMKVWLGVWQEKNETTNARQLDEMYKVLDKHGGDPFAGVIIGNEVLFRQDMTETQLAAVITGVRTNLTAKNIKLPLATSDLGDNWSPELASQVDIVMANVHPFFAGQPVDQAAAWTWDFWQQHDVATTTTLPNKPKQIISEVGWPSGGGIDCGQATQNCTTDLEHSTAGIEEMNQFMDTFVCQSLDNGTEYFWFEAFDEPWKARLNEAGKEWEDKWGLMDAQRKLKTGIKIPDCGGKVVS